MGIRVTATARGHYGDAIRNPGDEFEIDSVELFSVKWMISDDPKITEEIARRGREQAAELRRQAEALSHD